MPRLTAPRATDAQRYVLEGEQLLREGEVAVYTIAWPEYDSISSAAVAAFVGGSTVETVYFAGSDTVTGNVSTLPTLTVPAGQGGNTLVVEPTVVVGSETRKTGIIIRIVKPGDEP